MNQLNYNFVDINYILTISYNNTTHKNTAQTSTVEQALAWMEEEDNKPFIIGCKDWKIRNLYGKLIKSSKNVEPIK